MDETVNRRTMDLKSLQCVEQLGRKLTDEELTELIRRTYGMALLYGVQRTLPTNPEKVVTMPFTLFPSLLPRAVFRKSLELQTLFQTLIADVAMDHDFLKQCLKNVIPVDDFTRKLWEIYETVRAEGVTQDVSFMLTRNDFMMEATGEGNDELGLKQVEFNTFASGAGGVISGVREIHRYSMSHANIPFTDDQLPDNCPVSGMAQGMVRAWKIYNNTKACILFIVGVPEPNTPDQRWLEREIFKINRSIRVIYKTFDQILTTMSLGPKKELTVDGYEIGVVYYRYGYTPTHYPTNKEYDMRLQIERSLAIKCPSVALHLAGCKKVQQELSKPDVLERYVKDKRTRELLASTFTGQISLEELERNQDLIHKAMAHPEKFVLKPQREGGGNNLFGDEVKQFLCNVSDSTERSSWILMDRIDAYKHQNKLIRSGLGPETMHVVSELGVFGAYIRTPQEELYNTESGFLLRTKPDYANEGGLFNGLSCLDSPYLV